MLISTLSSWAGQFVILIYHLFVLHKESAGGDIQSPLTPESINGTDDERATPEVTQNSEPRAEPTQNALPFTHRYRFNSHILIKWYLSSSLLKGPFPCHGFYLAQLRIKSCGF